MVWERKKGYQCAKCMLHFYSRRAVRAYLMFTLVLLLSLFSGPPGRSANNYSEDPEPYHKCAQSSPGSTIFHQSLANTLQAMHHQTSWPPITEVKHTSSHVRTTIPVVEHQYTGLNIYSSGGAQ